MIRLKLKPPPSSLTVAKFVALTNLYDPKTQKPAVWLDSVSKVDIQSTLFSCSNHKCAYCERAPKDGGGDMQVDHYFPKDIYPHLVIWWYNLLPSCKACNNKKSTYDTGANIKIVNPFRHNPQEHFIMDTGGDLFGITAEGDITIKLLNLNDSKDPKKGLSAKRGNIIRAIKAELAKINEEVDTQLKKGTKPNKNTREQFYTPLLQLMENINPNDPDNLFIAAQSTAFLHPKSEYWSIKSNFRLWKFTSEELSKIDDLEKTIAQYTLAE
jgi:uncharacterized protein (TIGR02646 family)